MTCIEMGSDESHFNVSLIVRDKVTSQCPQTTTFEEKGEPKRYRTEVLRLPAYRLTARPNRLSGELSPTAPQFKPGTGQNVALHVSATARNSTISGLWTSFSESSSNGNGCVFSTGANMMFKTHYNRRTYLFPNRRFCFDCERSRKGEIKAPTAAR